MLGILLARRAVRAIIESLILVSTIPWRDDFSSHDIIKK
jgi:hypothetical protein